jgi:hypothetical protein
MCSVFDTLSSMDVKEVRVASVECFLWFPAPSDKVKVRLAALDWQEWAGLRDWAQAATDPILFRLLHRPLPASLHREQLLGLAGECNSVDWARLSSLALGGFASLSLFVDMATQQEEAGAWFNSTMMKPRVIRASRLN